MIPKKAIFQDSDSEKMKKVQTFITLSHKKGFVDFTLLFNPKKWF